LGDGYRKVNPVVGIVQPHTVIVVLMGVLRLIGSYDRSSGQDIEHPRVMHSALLLAIPSVPCEHDARTL